MEKENLAEDSFFLAVLAGTFLIEGLFQRLTKRLAIPSILPDMLFLLVAECFFSDVRDRVQGFGLTVNPF